MYADDDTVIYVSHKNISELEEALTTDMGWQTLQNGQRTNHKFEIRKDINHALWYFQKTAVYKEYGRQEAIVPDENISEYGKTICDFEDGTIPHMIIEKIMDDAFDATNEHGSSDPNFVANIGQIPSDDKGICFLRGFFAIKCEGQITPENGDQVALTTAQVPTAQMGME